MNKQELYEDLKLVSPQAAALAEQIQEAEALYANGDISKEEFEYIVNEIRDIRAAQELAGDEVAVRKVAQLCSVIFALI